MSNPNKKDNREQTETDQREKVQVSDDDLAQVVGGANFWFFDDERRKPRG